MSKLQIGLSSLLVLQIVIAAGLFLSRQTEQSDFSSQPLLAIDQQTVNKMVVSSADSDITLLKKNDTWVLPEQNNLPVNTSRLESSINKLAGLKRNWPVTTTTSSHQRFEVVEDNFQRKIALYKDESLIDKLYIGTSPGFKKSHIRPANEDNVFSLELNSYDFPVKPADWLDKQLLSAGQIQSIEGPDYALSKDGEQWQLAAINDQEKTDADNNLEINESKVTSLSQAFTSFSVSGISDTVPDFSAEDVINITITGEDKWLYQFLENEDQFYVKRNDIEPVFTLSKHEYSRLAELRKADLSIAVSADTLSESETAEANGDNEGS